LKAGAKTVDLAAASGCAKLGDELALGSSGLDVSEL
jgi:hypothetical protein